MMTSSEKRKVLRKEFGYPFTTKGIVRDKMGYSCYAEIRPFFFGLEKIGTRFFTDDVIDRIMEGIGYED